MYCSTNLMSLLRRLALLLFLPLALVACSSSPYPAAPAQAYSDDYNYILGPGDSVNIVVWRNPEISSTVTIRPDGKITGSLFEDLPAAGRDPTTLAREIEKVLAKYIRDPIVSVIVAGGIGPYSEQIRVIGEAAKPQALAYKQKMTLLDVMIAVGGITDFADGNAATILRTSEGAKQYNVRLKDLVRHGDVTANVDVKPGDILIIPQSWF